MTTGVHEAVPLYLDDDAPTPVRPVDTMDEKIAELKAAAAHYCETTSEAALARTSTMTFSRDARKIRRAKWRRLGERVHGLWQRATFWLQFK